MKLTVYLFVFSLSSLASSSFALTCRDEDNKPVDWFVLFKVPKLDNHFLIPYVQKGRGYMYITSETLNYGWVISKYIIFANNTSVGNTLATYYKNSNNSELWLFYNDQPPGSHHGSRSGGHTKGVIGGDKDGGIWLVHSVPHYPSLGPKYAYPSTGVKYGQSFVCISLSPSQLDSIGSTVLAYNSPKFYEKKLPTDLMSLYQGLFKAANNNYPTIQMPFIEKTTLSTLKTQTFNVFAKSKKFGKDLYEWVASDLGVDVMTETWRNGENPMPSFCNSTHKVFNINSISYKGISFNSSHDHSKWAISTQEETPWVCIGDINREVSQEKRGGGTVCLENEKLWKNYHDLAQGMEPCPKADSDLTYVVRKI